MLVSDSKLSEIKNMISENKHVNGLKFNVDYEDFSFNDMVGNSVSNIEVLNVHISILNNIYKFFDIKFHLKVLIDNELVDIYFKPFIVAYSHIELHKVNMNKELHDDFKYYLECEIIQEL